MSRSFQRQQVRDGQMTPQAHLDLCKRYYPSAVPDAAWSDDGRD